MDIEVRERARERERDRARAIEREREREINGLMAGGTYTQHDLLICIAAWLSNRCACLSIDDTLPEQYKQQHAKNKTIDKAKQTGTSVG